MYNNLWKQYINTEKKLTNMPPNVIFIGDALVGKTTIVSCLVENKCYPKQYLQSYVSTVAKEMHTVKINGRSVILHDMTGQPRWSELCEPYYKHANLAIICFNASDKNSFHSIDKWVTKFQTLNGWTPFIVVGNQIGTTTCNTTLEVYDTLYVDCVDMKTIHDLKKRIAATLPEDEQEENNFLLRISDFGTYVPSARCW